MGMGHAGFLGKWGGEREKDNNGKQRFKIFFFPASACAGKKENSAKTALFRVVFFFEENENKFGSDPKMGYDNYHVSVLDEMLVILLVWLLDDPLI